MFMLYERNEIRCKHSHLQTDLFSKKNLGEFNYFHSVCVPFYLSHEAISERLMTQNLSEFNILKVQLTTRCQQIADFSQLSSVFIYCPVQVQNPSYAGHCRTNNSCCSSSLLFTSTVNMFAHLFMLEKAVEHGERSSR